MRVSRRDDVRAPLVLALDLDRDHERLHAGAAFEPEPWSAADVALDRLGRLSGSALAAAWLLRAARADPGAAAPLVLAVGPCVRRGLPTAARLSIASRAPLTGLYTEGQVGTELGARLATVLDMLVLSGRARVPGAVLEVAGTAAEPGARGARVVVRLHALDGLAQLAPVEVAGPAPVEVAGPAPVEVARLVAARLGPCAVLCTGPGADRELPFASLAACGDPPSFVGRGGLGTVLARLGLKAVALTAPPRAVEPEAAHDGDELRRRLARSPRLRARGEGGTLELAPARAARGDLTRAASPTDADVERERELADSFVHDASERVVERKGCRGCPTPCGWVFETPADSGEPRRGAHFSALDALGFRLGLDRFEDVHALLGRCDALGIDAKEVGHVLETWCAARATGALAGPPVRGDRAALERGLDDLLTGAGDAPLLALGAEGMARALGLADGGTIVKGQAARRERSLAAVLGQCVSSRGADPMRTFPFLVGEGVDAARAAQLLAPYPITDAALDPDVAAETGRVVVWHEDFAAAVDATGFCAFSAAGLLTDGLCTLDELASWIAPEAVAVLGASGPPEGEERSDAAAGQSLLAAGASIVLAQRELNELWGAAPDADRPAWARALLDRPGMWDEYRALRGLDAAGRPTAEARARLATRAVLALGDLAHPVPVAAPTDTGSVALPRSRAAAAPGRVTLRCFGPLARELGAAAAFELALPATVRGVLAEVARRVPGAERWLVRDGLLVPAVRRAGRPLAAGDLVRDGDALDLVLAISGGAP